MKLRTIMPVLAVLVVYAPRTASAQLVIDNRCEARLLASGGGYLYWVDGETLRRSRLEKQTLPASKKETIDTNFTATSLAVDGDRLYWIDPDGKLFQSAVRRGELRVTAKLGGGYQGLRIAGGDGFLYIQYPDGKLLRHKVEGKVLQQGQRIDSNFTASHFAVIDNRLIWADPNGSGHIGTVNDNGQLKSEIWDGKNANWRPDLLAASSLGIFAKYGKDLVKH